MNLFRVLVVATAMLFGAASVHAQAVSGQGTWESTLQGRDVGNTGTTNAFYDTALNITWLRDANVNGAMDWNTAMSWANNLTVGGVSGWRLPTLTTPGAQNLSVNGTNAGWNVATSNSEMAHLYYTTLGNKAYFDTSGNVQTGWGMTNTGGFQNIQTTVLGFAAYYWAGTEYAPNTGGAWYFSPYDGFQDASGGKENPFYAMAVHNGDVALVPEPETYAMLLAGLGLIGFIRHRRRLT